MAVCIYCEQETFTQMTPAICEECEEELQRMEEEMYDIEETFLPFTEPFNDYED